MRTSPIKLHDRTIFTECFPYGDRSARYGKQSPCSTPLYASQPKEQCELNALWRLLQLRCYNGKRLISHRIHDDPDNCTLTLVYEVART